LNIKYNLISLFSYKIFKRKKIIKKFNEFYNSIDIIISRTNSFNKKLSKFHIDEKEIWRKINNDNIKFDNY